MKRRNFPKSELDEIVKLLSEEQPLPPKNKDHPLKGSYAGYKECHIRPDWLLIYKTDKQILTLVLIRAGIHSDLF